MHIGMLARLGKRQIPTPNDPTYCGRLVKIAAAYTQEGRKMNIKPWTLKRHYLSVLRTIKSDASAALRNRDGESSCMSMIGSFAMGANRG
ncbi:unnamed protein product [Soboliphyme baturini]|uniref:Transposase n=1 Tax=Soboliphyme baturini TaxID=241478 RepID=A0A183IPG6_9BILA|nr:unnamed protein product [Soboliphyme baturini]